MIRAMSDVRQVRHHVALLTAILITSVSLVTAVLHTVSKGDYFLAIVSGGAAGSVGPCG